MTPAAHALIDALNHGPLGAASRLALVDREAIMASEPVPEGFYAAPDWPARAADYEADGDPRQAAYCRYLHRHAVRGYEGEHSPEHFQRLYAAGELGPEAEKAAA